jgi:hypothetical protein
MKTCTKCKIEKEETKFSKDKSRKDGLACWCKECRKQYSQENEEKIREHQKQYRQDHKEEISKNRKQYYQENKEKELKQKKQWYQENKEESLRKHKEWYQENREEVLKNQRQYKKNHKEEISEYNKQYKQDHREETKKYNKQYRQDHKEEIKEYKKQYENKKRKNDICFRLRGTVSASINHALRRNNGGKNGSTILDYLPYTIQQLREHLEKQFESWMSWNNHGNYDSKRDTWQIDHIIPLSSFHYQSMDCEEFQKCWSLTNLRPLKSIDNIKKSNKITTIKGQNNA